MTIHRTISSPSSGPSSAEPSRRPRSSYRRPAVGLAALASGSCTTGQPELREGVVQAALEPGPRQHHELLDGGLEAAGPEHRQALQQADLGGEELLRGRGVDSHGVVHGAEEGLLHELESCWASMKFSQVRLDVSSSVAKPA